MSSIVPLLAALPDDFAPRKFTLGSGSRELSFVVAAVVLVSGLAVIWALFIRKKPRRHHHSHSQHHSTPKAANPEAPATGSESETGRGSRRRRRRRRRSELPRNPTLAETGGLPPVRGDEPSQPPR